MKKSVSQTRPRSVAKTDVLATAVAAIREDPLANGTDAISMAAICAEIVVVRAARSAGR